MAHKKSITKESNSTAIIFFGIIHRSLKYIIKSLRKNIIAPLNQIGDVDIFFHSWDVSMINNPRANEKDIVVDPCEVSLFLPEAGGIFESQSEFDSSFDWEPLFKRNPMKHFSRSEQEARITLMNFRRALESAERAWLFFQKNKTKNYKQIIVTRPDLKFLHSLEVDCVEKIIDNKNKLSRFLIVPGFHCWGGVNDRFAFGREKEISVWCQRTAFADGWLLKAENENPEWLLMQWLRRNQITPIFINFLFQRIRANGEITKKDCGLEFMVNSKNHQV